MTQPWLARRSSFCSIGTLRSITTTIAVTYYVQARHETTHQRLQQLSTSMDTDNGCFTLLACIASLPRSLEVTLNCTRLSDHFWHFFISRDMACCTLHWSCTEHGSVVWPLKPGDPHKRDADSLPPPRRTFWSKPQGICTPLSEGR